MRKHPDESTSAEPAAKKVATLIIAAIAEPKKFFYGLSELKSLNEAIKHFDLNSLEPEQKQNLFVLHYMLSSKFPKNLQTMWFPMMRFQHCVIY